MKRLAVHCLFVSLAACTSSREPAPAPEPSAVAEGPRVSALESAPTASSVGGATAPRDAGAAAKHAPRWTKSVKLDTLAGIPAAAAEDVLVKGEALELSEWPGEGKRTVRNCSEYDLAIADHFAPGTTFDISQASFFVVKCTPLRFLRDAWGSETSWVAELRFDKDPLGTLPATMNLAMEAPDEKEKEAFAKGQRLKAFDPKLVVTKSSATSVTFGHPTLDTSTVDILAWGDLDHDGVEDVLLVQSHHSLQGSFRSYRTFVATRRGAGQPLVVVRELP